MLYFLLTAIVTKSTARATSTPFCWALELGQSRGYLNGRIIRIAPIWAQALHCFMCAVYVLDSFIESGRPLYTRTSLSVALPRVLSQMSLANSSGLIWPNQWWSSNEKNASRALLYTFWLSIKKQVPSVSWLQKVNKKITSPVCLLRGKRRGALDILYHCITHLSI